MTWFVLVLFFNLWWLSTPLRPYYIKTLKWDDSISMIILIYCFNIMGILGLVLFLWKGLI